MSILDTCDAGMVTLDRHADRIAVTIITSGRTVTVTRWSFGTEVVASLLDGEAEACVIGGDHDESHLIPDDLLAIAEQYLPRLRELVAA